MAKCLPISVLWVKYFRQKACQLVKSLTDTHNFTCGAVEVDILVSCIIVRLLI